MAAVCELEGVAFQGIQKSSDEHLNQYPTVGLLWLQMTDSSNVLCRAMAAVCELEGMHFRAWIHSDQIR
jgi:hypothetical protein